MLRNKTCRFTRYTVVDRVDKGEVGGHSLTCHALVGVLAGTRRAMVGTG